MGNDVKHTVKDSVFTNLFQNREYVFELYRALHPEDTAATERDIEIITINNVIVNDIYNDLGFSVNDRLIVLVEAQSTWTENIVIRALMYLAQTYRHYFDEKDIDLYSVRKAHLPRPEVYVIYTGDRTERPAELSLNELFFDGAASSVEVKVKLLYGSNENDIVGQYVLFTKILDGQVQLLGRTREAVQAAIDICKDKHILKRYLEQHESEVRTIMMNLFDQDYVFGVYTRNVAKEARAEGERDGLKKGKQEGLQEGLQKGAALTWWQLIDTGMLTFADACKQAGMSEGELLKYKPEVRQ